MVTARDVLLAILVTFMFWVAAYAVGLTVIDGRAPRAAEDLDHGR